MWRLQLTPHSEVHRQKKKMIFPTWEMSQWCNDIQHIQKWDSSYFGGYFTAAHPRCELTKVLFAYDFGMEQADSIKPCYPEALTCFKLLTQTIQSTFPCGSVTGWRRQFEYWLKACAFKNGKCVKYYCWTEREIIHIHWKKCAWVVLINWLMN